MASSSSMLLNGERGVVFVFITRVLFSVPISLLYEALSLSLLSFAGLLVEIFLENSKSHFKARPAASSGILLGSVTLPTVMLSRLIQLSRAPISPPQDVGYLVVQYWVVSASCFSVLVFLTLALRRHSVNRRILGGLLSYVVLYTSLCFLSLATNDQGWEVAVVVKLFWIFSHGLAAVKLIQHILSTFPSCASIGEALLVTAGIILYLGDMLAYTLLKINTSFSSPKLVSSPYGMSTTEISTTIQGFLVGLLLFPMCYKFILQIRGHLTNSIRREDFATDENTSQGIQTSLVFYGSLVIILIVIVPAWMQFVHDFHMHPFLWVFNFVFSEPLRRLPLCVYWIAVISASVLRFYNISKHSKIERILLRKYYHLVAVLMFSPALIFQPSFLDLAFGAALAVFLILEFIRVSHTHETITFYASFFRMVRTSNRISLKRNRVQSCMSFREAYTVILVNVFDFIALDKSCITTTSVGRSSYRQVPFRFPYCMRLLNMHLVQAIFGPDSVSPCSHFSLLMGCALPKWMSFGFNDRPLAPFAGILSLGIGDTMASMVGHKYGVLRWSKTGKKTIEGTAAGITSVLVACSVLLPLLASTGYVLSQHWLSLLFAVTTSGLLEAYTAQLDNAFIPLVFYSLLCL
ncbi:hypothetical protein IFM89_033850 [Coptis chinensis]|uniref:dolichol kinase n=1 Tax=Coptis chinensis TaxID=261450 RepID=A0A835HWA6_9MAGN|nr:hypothetical protein IFM89_033850 [Coptis chinensis]